MNVEETVAEFIITARDRDVPERVLTAARTGCLDCAGVMVAGSIEEPARLMRAQVAQTSPTGGASIAGSSQRAAPSEAALANGVAGHVLDFDDMGAFGHPSAVLLPAVMSLGEATHANGRDVLTAYVTGFEVGVALEHGLGISQGVTGLHGTAMIGVFASTAAAAVLLRLDRAQVLMALGTAASMPAGLVQNFGTFTKSLHAGMAARNGVTAAQLAAAGWTANPSAFDGPGGVMTVYGRADAERLHHAVAELGQDWNLPELLTIKRFPCCGSTHAAVTAIQALIDKYGAVADDVEWAEVGDLSPSSHVLFHPEPKTGLQGKFSIQYVAARALHDRDVTIDSFADDAVHDRDCLAVKQRIRIGVGSKWSHGGDAFTSRTTVTLHMKDGRSLSHTTDRYAMLGTGACPLRAEAVAAKFRANCRRGGIDPEPALAAWSRLQELADVGEAVATITC